MSLPMPHNDKHIPDPPAAQPAAEKDAFVINLCSSTTPMALTQPQLAELKRYKFFVSRRLEDGRERFRLHMGYFDSLLQAEELLPVVREIYPGAWAGEAPGKRLRARDAAIAPTAAPAPNAAAQVEPDAALLAKAPTLAPDVELTMVAPTVAAPEMELTMLAPTLPAPPVLAPPAAETRHLPMLELELVPDAPRTLTPEPVAPAPAPAPPVATVPAVPAPRAATPFKRDANMPFDKRSNVREVLKSLDETGRAREAGALPESQVMRLLEEKRGDPLNTSSTPAAFAVQLQWSVQAIDLAQVPQLAIFGAYTLYTVEGSREGRKWYGLRLGFFSDANSAKTVAQYVRSDFSSVAVVPVSLRERDGANAAQGGTKAAPEPAPAQGTLERLPDQSAEFKLLDDTAERPKLPAAAAAAAAPAPAKPPSPAAARPAPRAAAKPLKGRGNRVHASDKHGPKTLEETLEILGADELQIEGAKKRKPTTGGAVGQLAAKSQKNSAFSRLLDRLAERKS